jgi:hypothetical protein
MRSLTKAAVGLAGLFVIAGSGGGARAATTLAPGNPVGITPNSVYTYGDTSFNFTACNGCSNLQIEAIFNGRGGTEIEILSSSDIFNNKGNNKDSSLNFTLQVNVNPGNRGISSITNILAGSSSNSTYNGNVMSALSSFSGVTGAPATLSSDLNTPTTTATFSLLSPTNSFSFNGVFSDNSRAANNNDTLVLSNVRLLFNPAPEPATIALLATGMAGLAAARARKRSGRVRPGNSLIRGS